MEEAREKQALFYRDKCEALAQVNSKDEQLAQLSVQLAQKQTELQNFQLVIANLNQTVMDKEHSMQQLVNKMTEMKQHLIDYQTATAIQKKYACLKLTTWSKTACTISFLEMADQQPHQFFLLIDSQKQDISINVENIETFEK